MTAEAHMPPVYTGVVTNKRLADWGIRAVNHNAQADRWASEYDKIKIKVEATPEYKSVPEAKRREFLGINWDLSDAAQRHDWHRKQANRLNNAIIAQAALRQMFNVTQREVE